MKKRSLIIFLLLFLLFILMIICTCYHTDNILSRKNRNLNPIDFKIEKRGENVNFIGTFQNKNDSNRLKSIISSKTLKSNLKVNPKLSKSDNVILLTKKLIPYFMNKYTDGNITYKNKTLTIDGVVRTEEDNQAIDDILFSSDIENENNTKIISLKDINFNLLKNKKSLSLSGNFNNKLDSKKLLVAIKKENSGNDFQLKKDFMFASKYQKNDNILNFTSSLINPFLEKYEDGSIVYNNKKLIINGTVNDIKDKELMENLLKGSKLAYVNNTKVKKDDNLEFVLTKGMSNLDLVGNFNNNLVSDDLAKVIDNKSLVKNIKVIDTIKENKPVIDLTKKLITPFMNRYQTGSITYKDDQFVIEGWVRDIKDKELMNKILTDSNLKFVDNTKLFKITKEAKEVEVAISDLLNAEHINFASGKADITPKSRNTIKKISLILNKYPNIKIEIGGHTDSLGDAKYNKYLSQARVDSVKKELAKLKIVKERMRSVGYGESMPLVPNDTKENQRKNRRVEFKIIGE